MVYSVTSRYKESANCRLEASYAHQQELDMIPLMMEESYKANGWLVSTPSAPLLIVSGLTLSVCCAGSNSRHAFVLPILSVCSRYGDEVYEDNGCFDKRDWPTWQGPSFGGRGCTSCSSIMRTTAIHNSSDFGFGFGSGSGSGPNLNPACSTSPSFSNDEQLHPRHVQHGVECR
jgi:hypothetical protein